MIKFFRRIRQNLLSEGKTGKYLKYAIGEILLVVIGILIAVAINGRYNASKNEEKIKAILTQAQQNILVDIKDAQRIFGEFIRIDSLSRNILADSVTIETNLSDLDFHSVYVDFNTNKSAFQQLVNNLENLPEKYSSLLPQFTLIYEVLQSDIHRANEALVEIAQNNKFDRLYTNPGHADYILGKYSKTETAIYYLNDPFLKNKTIEYAKRFRGVSRFADGFRLRGTLLYNSIDSLLDNPKSQYPDLLRIMPPEENMTPYLGDYEWFGGTVKSPDVSIIIDKDQFFATDRIVVLYQSGRKARLIWNKDSYFSGFPGINRFYKNEKGQHFLETSNGRTNEIYINKRDVDL